MSLISDRPQVVLRKAHMAEEKTPRKILVDFLKSSAIITADFTGSLELTINQGGLVDIRRVEKVSI